MSSFQKDLPCAILSSMQETAISGSGAFGLIFAIRTVFPNFSVQIPVGSKMLSTNRENHVVNKLSIFEKLPAFWKLMAQIGKILCAKAVRRIGVVGEFLAFWLVFIVFPAPG
jgi:hypothetical protein